MILWMVYILGQASIVSRIYLVTVLKSWYSQHLNYGNNTVSKIHSPDKVPGEPPDETPVGCEVGCEI
ncbi:hypothetical protein NDU88_002403 [Pleurodeles waltl]|uniref:Uncharacterized protein n=1 Tax=Pleurodeles waltl TaxID=8319 RepID=A0AAV7Q6S9_PLEWA|nr:hypothetical protein NDU88_002403 [Pleurodeles waltl]